MGEFDQFVGSMKSFERKLFALVASSFVFSTVAALAERGQFGIDFQTLTALVAGIMGVAGVLTQYLRNLMNARLQTDELLRMKPPKSQAATGLGFFIAALSLCGFYYLARNAEQICLLLLSIGIFVFFSSLSKCYLTIQAFEQQAAIWKSMTPAQQDEWRERERQYLLRKFQIEEQQREAGEKVREIIRDAERVHQDVQKTIRQTREQRAAWRREKRQEKWKRFRKKFYEATIRLRRRMAGDKLLTHSELADEVIRKAQADEVFAQAMENYHLDEFVSLLKEGIPPKVLEASLLKYYTADRVAYVSHYLVVDGDGEFNAQMAANYVKKLEPLRPSPTEKFREIRLVLKPATVVSFEAEKILKDTGLEYLRLRPPQAT